MEKHKCKVCSRKFSNGRALGGHMRSHLMILPITPKIDDKLGRETESLLSSSEEEIEQDEENEYEDDEIKVLMSYKLKGNPRKSIKLADLEDRESETESTRNPTRKRSKRRGRRPSTPETEPGSSVSDVTSEEDLAFCLIMLSRDRWTCHERDSGNLINKYKCETCDKVFKSYQALGGHRASHKKTRVAANTQPDNDNDNDNDNNNNNVDTKKNKLEVNEKLKKKIHECPICLRVFSSGQALGGHKRSHVIEDMNENYKQNPKDDDLVHRKKIKKENTILIDLNQPAPIDDEEISQINVSAVHLSS